MNSYLCNFQKVPLSLFRDVKISECVEKGRKIKVQGLQCKLERIERILRGGEEKSRMSCLCAGVSILHEIPKTIPPFQFARSKTI